MHLIDSMTDFNAKPAHDYWKDYFDPTIYRVLCWMESAEVPREENTLSKVMLKELGKVLDEVGEVDLQRLDQRDMLIRVANQLNMNQTLRLLQALNVTQAGSVARLLMHAENITKESGDEAGIFFQRNLVFERLRLIPRIFSKERLILIHKALADG